MTTLNVIPSVSSKRTDLATMSASTLLGNGIKMSIWAMSAWATFTSLFYSFSTQQALTKTSIWPIKPSAFFRKLMARLTMRLSSVNGSTVVTSQCINTSTNALDVNWINAGSVFAKMVSLICSWFDDVYKHLERNPMSILVVAIKEELAIAIFSYLTSPHPARRIWAENDFAEKSGKKLAVYRKALTIAIDHMSLQDRFSGSGYIGFSQSMCPLL